MRAIKVFLFFCLYTKEPKSQGLTVLAKSLTEGLSASQAVEWKSIMQATTPLLRLASLPANQMFLQAFIQTFLTLKTVMPDSRCNNVHTLRRSL